MFEISSPCVSITTTLCTIVRLFILVGLVSHSYAGPAAVLSWTLAGAAALLSAVCYAELSARIPVAGGAYAYVSTAIGELPAVITATCLSMFYIGASGMVARSWGDKVVAWVAEELGDTDHWLYRLIRPRGPLSPLACVVSSMAVLLLLIGVKESKRATNIFATLKVCVSIFMVVGGLYFVDTANWTPFVPPEFGVSGVMHGATATFSGYLGYDCVCGLGGEAIQPERNLPIAILFTLISVMALYVTATLALTGMQPYGEISPVSGFSEAFYAKDAKVVGEIVALGELATLPIVVLIAIMAEPRLMLALAEDKILPRYFRQISAAGNLWNGTLVAGSVMVVVSTFVPFAKLNDMISFAVLTILNLTDSSLVLLWHESPTHSRLAGSLLIGYHGCALVTVLLLTYFYNNVLGQSLIVLFAGSTAAVAMFIRLWCPRSAVFGGLGGGPSHDSSFPDAAEDRFFRTPFVPFWPCLGIFINWYLIVQLEVPGILAMLGILAGTTIFYVISGKRGDDPAEEHGEDHQQDHSSSSKFGGSVEL
jgi:basic amino acid/polyamine antiporter, APA family